MSIYLSAIATAECRTRLHTPNLAIHTETQKKNIHTSTILDSTNPVESNAIRRAQVSVCSLRETVNLQSKSNRQVDASFYKAQLSKLSKIIYYRNNLLYYCKIARNNCGVYRNQFVSI